jgi:hypothetical protein
MEQLASWSGLGGARSPHGPPTVSTLITKDVLTGGLSSGPLGPNPATKWFFVNALVTQHAHSRMNKQWRRAFGLRSAHALDRPKSKRTKLAGMQNSADRTASETGAGPLHAMTGPLAVSRTAYSMKG